MLKQWITQLLWRRQTRVIRPQPKITIKTTLRYDKSFTSPLPDINALIINESGVQVGRATYALSPLRDRVYVFTLEVADEFRRQGYGTALLTHLATTYKQPIVPIQELYSANNFWSTARQLNFPNLQIWPQLSCSEMDSERRRWCHLQPEIDRLEQIISERIGNNNEAWEVAISRGLPDWE